VDIFRNYYYNYYYIIIILLGYRDSVASCYHSTRARNSSDAQLVDRNAVNCLQIDYELGLGWAQKFTGVSHVEHENYLPTGEDWDIAVIKLPTPLRYDNYTSPVCLPSTPVDAGTKCVTTGWGDTQGTQNKTYYTGT